jgi:hypothetical protein
MGALLDKSLGGREADTARSAGDDGDFSIQFRHDTILFVEGARSRSATPPFLKIVMAERPARGSRRSLESGRLARLQPIQNRLVGPQHLAHLLGDWYGVNMDIIYLELE